MKSIAFTGNLRKETGKRASKAIRKEGRIPCVMYGSEDNIHFSTTYNDIRHIVYTPDFKVAEISVEGVTHRCILKEVQFHPVTENIQHIDFLKLEEDRPVKLEVPIRFKGVSPGVKNGGILQQSLRRIKIKTTPDQMVDEMHVDISNLLLGKAVRVRDLEVPEGIEVMNAPGIPVASVNVPRALRSEAEETEEEDIITEGEEGAEETTEEAS